MQNKYLGFLAVIGLLLVGVAQAKVQPRIVGGQDADPGEWPWITAMVGSGSNAQNSYCGASLIAPGWVLTAAHCVTDSNGVADDADEIDLVVGLYQRSKEASESNAQRFAVEEVMVHPDYGSDSLAFDIALLKLPSNSSATPIAMADENVMKTLAVGDEVTVIGWGATSENGSSSDVLQEVELELMSQADCAAYYGSGLSFDTLCAGVAAGGKDSCQGDSGGPLMVYHNGAWHLVGVVSFGDGCARPGVPGVYTRVASFESWLDSKITGSDWVRLRLDTLTNFGFVGNDRPETLRANLTNQGTTTVTVNSLSFGAGDTDGFTLRATACSSQALAPGQSCAVSISFAAASSVGPLAVDVLAQHGGSELMRVGAGLAYALAPAPSLGDDIESPTLAMYSGGDSPWQEQSRVVSKGASAVKSGDIEDNQISLLLTYIEQASQVSFDWRVSSEGGFDGLALLINNEVDVDGVISGESGWLTRSFKAEKGTKLAWAYFKDGSESEGDDAAYLDNLRLTAPSVGLPDGSVGGGGNAGLLPLLAMLLLLGRRFGRCLRFFCMRRVETGRVS